MHSKFFVKTFAKPVDFHFEMLYNEFISSGALFKSATPKAVNVTVLYHLRKKDTSMSKEIKENASANTTTPKIVIGKDLEELMVAHPNASIRKLAAALEINYGILLSATKAPVPGEAYDPTAVNYDKVVCEIVKRKKNFLTLDWDALNEGKSVHGTALVKDTSKFVVGSKVYLRRNNEKPYEIVYRTETHIVLMLQDTTEPQAWAISTFMLNGPVFEPRSERA